LCDRRVRAAIRASDTGAAEPPANRATAAMPPCVEACRVSPWVARDLARLPAPRRRPAPLGGGELVTVEFVDGSDQATLGPDGGFAASMEASVPRLCLAFAKTGSMS
jgi:hypothetical protein